MIYYNSTYSKEFKKNDCPEDLGSTELFVVPEAQFVSSISQEDADNKAIEWAEEKGQAYANKVGRCCRVYYNEEQTGEFYSRVCGEGTKQKDPTVYSIPAGSVVSNYSVEDANFWAKEKLIQEGQAKADAEGVCKNVFFSAAQHGWYNRKCPEGWASEKRYRIIEAGAAYSFDSQEDADKKAKEMLNERASEWVSYATECHPVVGACSSDSDFY